MKDAGVLDGNFKGGNESSGAGAGVDEDRFNSLMAKVNKLEDQVQNLEGCLNSNTKSIEEIVGDMKNCQE